MINPLEAAPNVSDDLQKKVALIGALAGIVGLWLYLRNRQSVSTGVPIYTGGAGTATTDLSSVDSQLATLQGQVNKLATGAATTVATAPSVISLAFSRNSGQTTTATNASGKSSSGSGGGLLTVLGLGSLGGGGSSSGASTTGTNASIATNGLFQSNVTLTGATAEQVTQAENWITSLAGTDAQVAKENLAQGASVYPYLYPGTVIAPKPGRAA